MIKILIVSDSEYLCESDEKPKVGAMCVLEDARNGSAEQRRTFFALNDCLYSWMLSTNTFVHEVDGIAYDFSCSGKNDLRKKLQAKYGEGYNGYEYVNNRYQIVGAKTTKEIPDYVVEDYMSGNKERINPQVKTLTKYTIPQYITLIDNVKNVMLHIGINTKKFEEILKGMEDSK